MFDTEAMRIRQILLELGEVSPLLNLGSSTLAFRTVTKPHIDRELFAPLRAAGVVVVHCDVKAGEGVDLVGSLLDPKVRERLKTAGARCVLLSNVLEHVPERERVTAACEDIVGPGGYVLATVPSSFPLHYDPIDTYYRPTPTELAQAFSGSRVVSAEELEGRTYAQDIRARGANVWSELAGTVVAALLFLVRPKSAIARVHRWFWYARPRRVSIALVQVKEAAAASAA